MNHLISEELPFDGGTISNSDPITGQAGWYDVRVRIRRAEPGEAAETFPQINATPAPPGGRGVGERVLRYFAKGAKA